MSGTSSDSSAQPNVVVVFTDQQRWDTVGCYGSPLDLTPNLDAAAREGVRFQNAFTCQPVCAPARASLQTGKYATSTGVFRNGLPIQESERTLAHHFRDAGYEVGYVGKWHLAGREEGASAIRGGPVPEHRRGGYVDYWLAADLTEFVSHPYDTCLFDEEGKPVKLEGYRVDATTELALQFVRRARNRPFYLFVSYLEPHHQNDLNRFVAPEGYAERYANSWIPEDLLGRPGDWPSQLPDYYGAIARIDECLGTVLTELEALGLAENTIVLFTSDHGCHFRTRNDEYKRSCHEACIRIPAVLWGPGVPRGRVVDNLVSLVDLPATLLSAAGLAVPSAMRGQDLMPLARGEDAGWSDEVFLQISEAEVGRAIRTRRWKYSVYAPERDPWRDSASPTYVERYLYDLAADPHERVNLIGRKDHAAIAGQLRERLIERIERAGEPRPEILPARYPAG